MLELPKPTGQNVVMNHINCQNWVLTFLISVILGVSGCGPQEETTGRMREATSSSTSSTKKTSLPLRIAAASDLKFALEEILVEFRRTHPGIQVQAIFGASGTLFAQLTREAPYDLFLSADLKYPRQLVEQGQADAATEFKYAVGHIVVWVTNKSPLDVEKLEIQSVIDPRVHSCAIANPQHAPYGRAAEAALKSLNVYDQVADRLVLGENISQTAHFVESGAADIGILSLSLARSPAMRDKGRYWEVPVSAYPKLEQGGVILKTCQDMKAAREFQAFLTGAEGGTILQKFGFVLPGE